MVGLTKPRRGPAHCQPFRRGRQSGEVLLAVAQPRRGRGGGGGGGAVWQLNMYPVSRDAGTAPAASLWSPGATDLVPLMRWAIKLAGGVEVRTRSTHTALVLP